MKTSFWSKVFGWSQFLLTTGGQIGQAVQQTHPAGFWGWLPVGISFLVALANHHASNTDGTK